jgi:A/G-specific adenine glycosylase
MVESRRQTAKQKSAAPVSAPPGSPGPAATARLLEWYDRYRRALPWRALPGETPDPYRVWLSEIMLQQTTVATVKAYFAKFTIRWPDVTALAAAEDQEILAAWAGLGYYARARNLIACARAVAAAGGRFPDAEDGLRALPGVGAYTAAAIAAIAFDRPAIVIDGNIERVVTRLAAIATPLPQAKAEIRAVLAPMVPADRPGDFAQSLMDLGAGICSPRNPDCLICPLRPDCAAAKAGEQLKYPVKPAKKSRPIRFGNAYVVRDGKGRLLLGTRPGKGLLAGMAEVPGSDWTENKSPPPASPINASWTALNAPVIHVFTHFELRIMVHSARIADVIPAPAGLRWVAPEALSAEPLPTLMTKIIAAAGG